MSQTDKKPLIGAQIEPSPIIEDLEVTCYPVEQVKFEALPKKFFFRVMKRTLDILVALFALLLLAIPAIAIALFIKLDSNGPILFRQERVGENGKPFMLIKFRSMRNDAEANGAQWASVNDARVTRVGRFLRGTRLDEIPQFINVLKGEMSLIGPRPERRVFYERFETYIPGFSQRLFIRPGISGLAQVNGGYDLAPEEKIVYDIEYIKRRSIRLDALILVKTVAVMFTRVGAR